MILMRLVAENAQIIQGQEAEVAMMSTTPIVRLIPVRLIRFREKMEVAPIVQNTKW